MQPNVLITRQAHTEYQKETFPFQKIRGMVNIRDIKKVSFFITFTFCDAENENNVFATGYQQVVLADKNKKIIKFPSEIIDKVKQYQL